MDSSRRLFKRARPANTLISAQRGLEWRTQSCRQTSGDTCANSLLRHQSQPQHPPKTLHPQRPLQASRRPDAAIVGSCGRLQHCSCLQGPGSVQWEEDWSRNRRFEQVLNLSGLQLSLLLSKLLTAGQAGPLRMVPPSTVHSHQLHVAV